VADDLEPPLRGEPLFDELGNPTIRFAEFLSRTGIEINTLISVSDQASNISLIARIAEIEQRLGSGDPLTSDEIGFTVDSIEFTVDMIEA